MNLIEILTDKENIQKFRNSPIFIIIIILSMVCFFPQIGYIAPENRNSPETYDFYNNITLLGYVYIACCILVLSYLIMEQIKNNTLPRAKFGNIAVLFIIKAADKKDYDLLNKQLVERFDEVMRTGSKINFQVLYIDYYQLKQKQYDLLNETSLIKLLQKTNCVFCIQINTYSSKGTRIAEFEMEIKTGVIHPAYQEDIARSFIKEMEICTKPLNNIPRVSNGQINFLYNTAQFLSYTCRYVIGLMAMIEKDLGFSNIIFNELRESLIDEETYSKITTLLLNSVNHHCYNLNIYLSHNYYTSYEDTGNLSALNDMEDHLYMANEIFPNTYYYHLEIAIVHVLKYRDYATAQKHIDECRVQDSNGDWRYSDAFLFAYNSKNTWKIYGKYRSALKYDTELGSVIYFIEKVMQKEPDKFTLHLALGLLYEKADSTRLMKHHFTLFMHKSLNANPYTGVNAVLNSKIKEAPCNEENCKQLCEFCVE